MPEINAVSLHMLEKLSQPLRSQTARILYGEKQLPSKGTKTSSPTRLEGVHRTLDLCGASIMLGLLSPVILVVSLTIFISSGMPILFRQKRLGKNGRLVTIFKFRSMRKDAEQILREDEELYRRYVANDYKLKPEEDPRVTKFGSFLRRSSLDEIPQVLNVIKGEMSLVGPRPVTPPEMEQYGEHAEELLSVKPGITGLWQVTGRSAIAYPERRYLELIYAQNKSIFLDLKIMLKTIRVVVLKIGAY